MSKDIAVLSNKIYLPYSKELYLKLSEELTYKFMGRTPDSPLETITTLSAIGQRALLIPIGRMDLIPKGLEIKDKRVKIKTIIPEPSFILRPSQQEFVDFITEDNPVGILNAKPGFGKSYAAIALAYKTQMKTLIVVHTVELRKQWEEDIKKVTGIIPGVIGSGSMNSNSPIVVANVQTLAKHMTKYNNKFGMIVLDEAHHTPASTFSKILGDTKAFYRIGLTGTLERKDTKQILTKDYFGHKNIFKPPQENIIKPNVILYNTKRNIPGNMMTPWAIRMNKLTQDRSYQVEIINLVLALKKRDRKILIISDRVEFLQNCSQEVSDSICIVGITENKKDLIDEIRNGKKDNIWASINIFKEGMSVDELDTLVLGNPINNEPLLEQVIGRIMRYLPDKKIPEVYDISFSCGTGQNQLRTRMAFYENENYEIKELQ